MATTNNTKGGPPVYGRGFLPGTFQPTVLRNSGSPVLYLEPPGDQTPADQRGMLDLVQWLNQDHAARRGGDTQDLAARIPSYRLSFRMQSAVPDAVDLSKESALTRQPYSAVEAMPATCSPPRPRGGRRAEAGREVV